jgi:hypothetical protein
MWYRIESIYVRYQALRNVFSFALELCQTTLGEAAQLTCYTALACLKDGLESERAPMSLSRMRLTVIIITRALPLKAHNPRPVIATPRPAPVIASEAKQSLFYA